MCVFECVSICINVSIYYYECVYNVCIYVREWASVSVKVGMIVCECVCVSI